MRTRHSHRQIMIKYGCTSPIYTSLGLCAALSHTHTYVLSVRSACCLVQFQADAHNSYKLFSKNAERVSNFSTLRIDGAGLWTLCIVKKVQFCFRIRENCSFEYECDVHYASNRRLQLFIHTAILWLGLGLDDIIYPIFDRIFEGMSFVLNKYFCFKSCVVMV